MATAAELLAIATTTIAETMESGRLVTYRRPRTSQQVEISVGVREGGVLRVTDHKGVRIERSDRDYTIRGSVLLLDGVRTEPERGDEIVDANEEDTLTHVYQVMSLPNEKAWYWDSLRLVLLIHTKHIGTE